MSGSICIHGHFYQPPRQDPWLEEVLPEASAAPFSDWNERISRECYSPLAFARILDNEGGIQKIINCYEWINFNFGPTILSWMERHLPRTYDRILQADRASLKRNGHGNAMAQVYHHTILPLDSPVERRMEIRWSIYDFLSRFGRRPEGMWLAETAVNTPTLEDLAAEGIKFTILASAQAEAVAPKGDSDWQAVNPADLNVHRPYEVPLPSGRTMSVFFFHPGLATAIAFEGLLADGEKLWQRLAQESEGKMTVVATDGESYGHHFKFGEMALAYALNRAAEGASGPILKNAGQLLEEFPPEYRVRIREDSSWSCVHGLARWQEHCGCADGGHPGWKQHWRKPLRRALNYLKYYADEHFSRTQAFASGRDALMEYGRVLSGLQSREEFAARWFLSDPRDPENVRYWSLLEMQRHCLASFASCAWFFDDLYRLEPMNALASALRGMQLLRAAGGPDVREGFLELMEDADSNRKEAGNGCRIWTEEIEPRLVDSLGTALAASVLGVRDGGRLFPGVDFSSGPGDGPGTVVFEVTWKRTGFQERVEIESVGGGLGRFGLLGDAKGLRFDRLAPRLKAFVQNHLASVSAAEWWAAVLHQAEEFSASGIYTEPGQEDLPASLQPLAPGLVWHWVQGGRIPIRALEPAVRTVRGNPLLKDIFKKELEKDLLQRLGAGSHGEDLCVILSRAREIEVYPDMFEIQNLLWSAPGEYGDELLRMAGLSAAAGVG